MANPDIKLMLSPYGQIKHYRGMQMLDRNQAKVVVDTFLSLNDKIRRRFGGVPVYIGHPDDVEYHGMPEHDDLMPVGWIVNLLAADDGLYADTNWTKHGRETLEKTEYHHVSPRWLMKFEHGLYLPYRLVSVGLTNHPNIPGCKSFSYSSKSSS